MGSLQVLWLPPKVKHSVMLEVRLITDSKLATGMIESMSGWFVNCVIELMTCLGHVPHWISSSAPSPCEPEVEKQKNIVRWRKSVFWWSVEIWNPFLLVHCGNYSLAYFFFFYNDEANGKYGVNKEGNISKPYFAGLSRIVVIWHSLSHPQTALCRNSFI